MNLLAPSSFSSKRAVWAEKENKFIRNAGKRLPDSMAAVMLWKTKETGK